MMTTLQTLMNAEEAAYAALMNDPRVIADPKATHTPGLYAAWEAAADAELAFRKAMAVEDIDMSPCPLDPDNYWIVDATGERIAAS